jgi:hypothetical protein
MSEQNADKVDVCYVFAGSDRTITIRWPKALKQDKNLFDRIQRGNELLQAELGNSRASVEAEWTRANDPTSPLTLKLTDLYSKRSVEEDFTYKDFDDRDKLATRIHKMWGRLLDLRSGEIIKSVQDIILRSGG